MKSPSVTRLVLYTILVLTGAGLILVDRVFLVGLFLVCFSNVILMNKREREDQKKKLATPLTKWQIIRGFIPLLVMLGLLGCYLAITTYVSNTTVEQHGGESGWHFKFIWTRTFKTVFLLAVAFVIGQPWMRWYQTRRSDEQPDATS